ncbi:MAG: thioesterase family protein [Pseudomonadota bacterium]
MTDLNLLHDSVVTAAEIDSLGHLNVRFYVRRVAEASRILLQQHGIELQPGQSLRRVDTYNRFHREQFEGAPLHTLGGFIASESGNAINAYFEIRNPESDVVAATFIVTNQIVDDDDQPIPDTQAVQSVLQNAPIITVPEYGAPRSLSLKPPSIVTMAEIDQAVGDTPPGMMSGRRENAVHAEHCNSQGRLRDDMDLMAVLHPLDAAKKQDEKMGPPIMRDAQGRRFSWAMLETRSVMWHRPMLGDQLLSIGADIASAEKWRQSRRWMFVKDTGLLLGVSDSLGICIDLDARKAITIPEDVREEIDQNSLPQFA